MTAVQPMRLLRFAHPFDHRQFVYEWKIDGFRGLASVDNGHCRLVSRNGHTFSRWDALKGEIAALIACRSARRVHRAALHQTFRVAAAMEAGLTPHVWNVEESVTFLDAETSKAA